MNNLTSTLETEIYILYEEAFLLKTGAVTFFFVTKRFTTNQPVPK